ncbi:DUF4012 domain-containing protein [Kineosporia sp. R_H_3]|uniref:DUF4012 domain-containing protein n=1 Tax=Kineosporia sp. R_H_3 TaxID=1961848 RepID=UPI000B4AAD38|nr:DUF4012 domain-containing protein [Kineosporia sp. R_H_3]
MTRPVDVVRAPETITGPARHSRSEGRLQVTRGTTGRGRAARRRRKHTVRWVLGGAALLLLFVVSSALWIAWTGLQAKSQLEGARSDLALVQTAWSSGAGADAMSTLASVQVAARTANDRTHDPVWWFWGHVPVAGSPIETVRGLTEAVDALASDALPSLESAADVAQPSRMVTNGSTVDVTRLANAAGALQTASTVIDDSTARVQDLPASYVPQVAAARAQLLDQLTTVGRTARTAAVAARVVPPMLGAQGDRRYFLAFQNLSETRGTGGLIDAYATLVASKGSLDVRRVGSNADLPALPLAIPGIDPDYDERYATQGATSLWVNSNLSPDFPEVSRAWAAMWEAGTKERVDGTFALDPVALKGILAVTGPVQAGELGTVDAAGVEKLVYDGQYRLGKDVYERKRVMLQVGTATIDAVLSGRGDRAALLKTLVESARTGHILVWSGHADEQKAVTDGGVGGAVLRDGTPFVQSVFVNAAGTKLDAYLQSSLSYAVTECSGSARRSKVTLSVKNSAPASGLPDYVVTRGDVPTGRYVVGQNKIDAQLLVSKGSRVLEATLDGKPLGLPLGAGELPDTIVVGAGGQILGSGVQAGLPSYGLTLDLEPGQSRTMTLTLAEPPTKKPAVVRAQALVRPTTVKTDLGRCG